MSHWMLTSTARWVRVCLCSFNNRSLYFWLHRISITSDKSSFEVRLRPLGNVALHFIELFSMKDFKLFPNGMGGYSAVRLNLAKFRPFVKI